MARRTIVEAGWARPRGFVMGSRRGKKEYDVIQKPVPTPWHHALLHLHDHDRVKLSLRGSVRMLELEPLIGAWRLVSFGITMVDTGERTEPFGPQPHGRMVLEPGLARRANPLSLRFFKDTSQAAAATFERLPDPLC